MATYTTNLNLKKPAQSDKIRIADINNNMDDIDATFGAIGNDSVATQIGDIQDALAIVSVGDSHAAITAGQYVYVKSHETLDTGLYVASANIAQNGALSSSNLTADTAGGLNALNSKLNTNGGVITVQRTTGNTNSFYKYSKIGNVVTVYIEHHASDATINAWGSLDFPGIPSGFRPIQDIVVPASTDRSGSSGMIFTVFPSGVVRLNCKYNAMNDSSDIVRSTVTYAVSF